MVKNAEPIYAFIDSQNLNLSVKNDVFDKTGKKKIYEGWKLDPKRFYIYLRDKYKVDKSFLFIGKVQGQETLYKFLKDSGYSLIFKPTLEYSKGMEKIIKGNVDAELVLHTMIQFPNYSKAIIVSGDGDFHCLIEYLAQQGKLSYIFIPNKYRFSSLLKTFRQYFVYVSDLRKKLEYRK